MLTIGAFSSLAQLGAGLALALAIFTEPIANRERGYRSRVENGLMLIADRSSADGAERVNRLLQNMINLDTVTDRAKQQATVPVFCVKVGALINFLILIAATVCPYAEISPGWTWMLLALCVLPIGIGTTWLFLLANLMIGSKERKMDWS
jgi:hypothetical protein